MAGDIPEDVLTEILSRLPVKSLIRLTIVCKSWRSLIKGRKFISKHLQTTHSNLYKNNFSYFYSYRINCFGGNSPGTFSFYLDDANFSKKSTMEFEFVFNFEPGSVFISPPCHGIFCLYFDRYDSPRSSCLIIWNPTIRDAKSIPLPPAIVAEGGKAVLERLGFNYDPKTDDYKVVFITDSGDMHYRNAYPTTEVYSLRNNSWKTLPRSSFMKGSKRLDCPHPTINGKMCNWSRHIEKSISGRGNDYSEFMSSFDITDEVFIKTPLPRLCTRPSYMLLQDNQGDHDPSSMPSCLSYFDSSDLQHLAGPDSCYEIWVLDEYGPQGSWTKQFSIAHPDGNGYFAPTGCWYNDDFLFFLNREQLFSYDPLTQQLTYIDYDTWSGDHLNGYVGSLISPKVVLDGLKSDKEDRGREADDDLGSNWVIREVCMKSN